MHLNRYSGWLIGTFLSILPRRICFYFHYMAEKQAANGYKDLMTNIENNDNQKQINLTDIKSEIKEIIESEKTHSEIFKALIN